MSGLALGGFGLEGFDFESAELMQGWRGPDNNHRSSYLEVAIWCRKSFAALRLRANLHELEPFFLFMKQNEGGMTIGYGDNLTVHSRNNLGHDKFPSSVGTSAPRIYALSKKSSWLVQSWNFFNQ